MVPWRPMLPDAVAAEGVGAVVGGGSLQVEIVAGAFVIEADDEVHIPGLTALARPTPT